MDPEKLVADIVHIIECAKTYDQVNSYGKLNYADAAFPAVRRVLPKLLIILQDLANATKVLQVADDQGTPQGAVIYYEDSDAWKRLQEFARLMQDTQF